MKTILSLLILISITFSHNALSQDITVYYSIEIKNAPKNIKERLRLIEMKEPSEMILRSKGDKSYFKQKILGMNQVIVFDNATKSGFVLMSYKGLKYCIKVSEEELKALEAKTDSKPKIEYTTGKKKILGYICKKAYRTDSEGQKSTIYYTNELGVFHNDYKTLDGFPLFYSMKIKGGIVLEVTASLIDNSEIDEKLFEIPDGYKIMSYTEFKEKMSN